MKATAQIVTTAVEKSTWSIVSELVKARLSALVLVTTFVGFYLGSSGPIDYWLLTHTLVATGLLAAGAAALNQLLEKDLDARMRRTEDRPLPSGRVQPETVLIFGGLCSGAGLVYLALGVNVLTALLGAITLVSYLFVYTPLKQVTTLNTLIGAVPGAIPPLMGWTAATDEVSAAGWSLFAILFFWQLPHFMAIAWLYREDYARAGYAMLSVVDKEGVRTGRSAISHTMGLLSISLFPVVLGVTGGIYAVGAIVFGLLFLAAAIQFSRQLSVSAARRLFFVSIIYLPLLLGLMVYDKVR